MGNWNFPIKKSSSKIFCLNTTSIRISFNWGYSWLKHWRPKLESRHWRPKSFYQFTRFSISHFHQNFLWKILKPWKIDDEDTSFFLSLAYLELLAAYTRSWCQLGILNRCFEETLVKFVWRKIEISPPTSIILCQLGIQCLYSLSRSTMVEALKF
jgi:hypothetical protein